MRKYNTVENQGPSPLSHVNILCSESKPCVLLHVNGYGSGKAYNLGEYSKDLVQSLLCVNLSYFWNKQRLLHFDLFKFLNKQSSLWRVGWYWIGSNYFYLPSQRLEGGGGIITLRSYLVLAECGVPQVEASTSLRMVRPEEDSNTSVQLDGML
jgi:hypothetical protein